MSGNGNDGNLITIRQLLQHTSGLHSYTDDMREVVNKVFFLERRFDHIDPEVLVANALQTEPEFPAGTSWRYSNTNYVLLGMIVERAKPTVGTSPTGTGG